VLTEATAAASEYFGRSMSVSTSGSLGVSVGDVVGWYLWFVARGPA
jgi:hypothetical protein